MTKHLTVALLALVLAVPIAGAHMDDCKADTLCHLTLNVQELPPGAVHAFALHSERISGDFPAGWLITAFAGIQGEGTVNASLTLENQTRHVWSWTGNKYSSNSSRITQSGHYELKLTNEGDASVRYAFYFDQSCNCAYKVIPINGGFVLFNYDLPADRDVRLGFPTIDGWHLKGSLARLNGAEGRWPQDFEVLATAEQKNKGWLQFDFHTEEPGTHYFFIEAIDGVKAGPEGRPQPVELTPLLEVEEARSPGLGILAIAAVLTALILARRRS